MIERTAPIDPAAISDRPRGVEIKAYRQAAGVSREALAAAIALRAVARECEPAWFIETVEDWYADRSLDRRMIRRYVGAIDAVARAAGASATA